MGSVITFFWLLILSARCPVYFAPAMDLGHVRSSKYHRQYTEVNWPWSSPSLHPEEGELASGLIGEGRMAEPEHIVQDLYRCFFRFNRFIR